MSAALFASSFEASKNRLRRTAANCAVTCGANGVNWGSCLGTYAFTSLEVDGLRCYDPFTNTTGCPPRTHWTAIHLNHAYSNDCMPEGATLSLANIEYHLSGSPMVPVGRPKCGSCRSCCQTCPFGGFDSMRIEFRDDSVLDCNYTIPGC